ncbi:MAG TPA: hypothetical protein VMB80_15440 [Candidatus Acidoferrum sp.]|nr:hypothetical protein [Candidatus Acidoferrum sp.]
MNSVSRLILRGLASGQVAPTPQVLSTLKSVNQDVPDAGEPTSTAPECASHAEQSDPARPAPDKHQKFADFLPGRRLHRTAGAALCALMLGHGLVRAASGSGMFEVANEAFARGNFAEAARDYESIISQEGYSAPLLFNLANAQQRSGELGPAILNYERATLLTPRDPDIATNLQLARKRAGVPEAPRSRLQPLACWLTLNGWLCFAAVALFLLIATLTLRQLYPDRRHAFAWGGAPAAVAFGVAILALAVQWPGEGRAIVIAPEAVAGVSPVTMAQPVCKFRSGETVVLKQTHGGFALVADQAGREGWVKTGDAARVIP